MPASKARTMRATIAVSILATLATTLTLAAPAQADVKIDCFDTTPNPSVFSANAPGVGSPRAPVQATRDRHSTCSGGLRVPRCSTTKD
jgi:hypothetical protein